MVELFPLPSVGDQVESVDHLRKDARAKIAAAVRMHDVRIAEHWRQELDRLTRLRAAVLAGSQMDLLATHDQQQGATLI